MLSLTTGKRDEMELKAADIIASSISELIKKNGRVVLAVPGGRSVSGIFQILSEQDIDWSKVHLFMVDERLVPLSHPESNYNLVKDAFGDLLSEGLMDSKNLHPFIMDESKSDFGISNYSNILNSLGGHYDIILLSSGEDGHVGALFPDHHSVKDDSEMFLIMDDSPKPPPNRMTSSRNLILKSNKAVVVFFGEAKRKALEKFYDDSIKEESCPVKYLAKVPECHVLSDISDIAGVKNE